jgi:hypothetical protein
MRPDSQAIGIRGNQIDKKREKKKKRPGSNPAFED